MEDSETGDLCQTILLVEMESLYYGISQSFTITLLIFILLILIYSSKIFLGQQS